MRIYSTDSHISTQVFWGRVEVKSHSSLLSEWKEAYMKKFAEGLPDKKTDFSFLEMRKGRVPKYFYSRVIEEIYKRRKS